jgi:putative DNA methylase
MSHKRRLIEHRLPLEKISEASAREKSIRHGHISTLHIWWARRPLAASRAAVFATLVPDTEENYQLVKRIVPWEAVKDGNSKDILEARRRVLEAGGGTPPRVLDPFAGGGAIPLEALRLGCETHALDLNPVAYLILKATLEYPQRFGQPNSRPVPTYIQALDQAHAQARDQAAQGTTRLLEEGGEAQEEGPFSKAYRENPLAAEVRYWGEWVLERARQELAQFYPKDPDGRTPVAYLWARTVTCTNPTCRAEVPLVRQWWLAKKDKKRIALKPLVDREARRVDFQVVEVPQGEDWPDQGTVRRGNATCLVCGTVVPVENVRSKAKQGNWGERMLAVVMAEGGEGKAYRPANDEDRAVFERARARLAELQASPTEELSLVPDEPLPPKGTLGFRVNLYGIQTWGQLFNPRQALALVTFAKWVREAHAEMLRQGMDEELAKAVATYLGITVDRLADRCSSLTHWDNPYEKIANTFARQALPMVWDYAELNPFSGSTGDYEGAIEWVGLAIRHAAVAAPQPGVVHRGTATHLPFPDGYFDAVVTDPPITTPCPTQTFRTSSTCGSGARWATSTRSTFAPPSRPRGRRPCRTPCATGGTTRRPSASSRK